MLKCPLYVWFCYFSIVTINTHWVTGIAVWENPEEGFLEHSAWVQIANFFYCCKTVKSVMWTQVFENFLNGLPFPSSHKSLTKRRKTPFLSVSNFRKIFSVNGWENGKTWCWGEERCPRSIHNFCVKIVEGQIIIKICSLSLMFHPSMTGIARTLQLCYNHDAACYKSHYSPRGGTWMYL